METLKSVDDAIAQAFKGAKMPRSPRELAPKSIDADSVIEHFLGKSREQVESADFNPGLHMEDFSYMTPMGVEYYLPPVLRIMLREPWDDSLWIYLHGYLKPDGQGKLWWNLGELSGKQLLAIAKWAGFLHGEWSARPPGYIDLEEAAGLSDAYRRIAGRK
jgi:hypothetical protein